MSAPVWVEQGRRAVLLVEDEPGIRAALEAHFAREGWQVAAASGVREAGYRLAQGEFDLVVSDMRLPDGSGADLLRAAQGTPVVLMTAFGAVAEAVAAMRAGACDYLPKPIEWAQLRTVAERFAGIPRAEADCGAEVSPAGEAAGVGLPGATPVPIRELERMHLQRTLELVEGNRTRAAEMLGISLRTMRNKIREYGLPPRRYA